MKYDDILNSCAWISIIDPAYTIQAKVYYYYNQPGDDTDDQMTSKSRLLTHSAIIYSLLFVA